MAPSARYGASPDDWTHFDLILGVGSDLLPVVSNPTAQISPDSKLKGIGKTPSLYNRDGLVVGIADWTRHQASDADIRRWAKVPDYGICVQTRTVRALDIDVPDFLLSNDIVGAIIAVLGPCAVRWRNGTGKALIPVIVPGDMPKRQMPVQGGMIEFLATGQQFVAVGTHPDGTRYQWAHWTGDSSQPPVVELPDTIPELTLDQLNALWQSLAERFAIEPVTEGELSLRQRGEHLDLPDDLADFLHHNDRVLGTDRDGALLIECPWDAEHSTGTVGDGSTVYFPAGTNGYEQGHFKCLHGHCAGRGDSEFQHAIGYFDNDFEVLPALPDEFTDIAPTPDAVRFMPIPAHDFSQGTPPSWIIKGVLPQAELVVLFGESGSGKSFLALDMAGAITRGEPWRNLRTRQGRVVYIAAEGGGGFRNRLKAYAQHYQVDLATMPLSIIHAAPNFLLKDDALDVAKGIKAAGGADVVIVDTFAQVIPGANENAAEDMGKALAHCKGIHRATGAVVVLVHHAGKDASKGARGWSGLKAAADAEIEVLRLPGGRMCRVSKQKDGEDGAEWGFDLLNIPVGMDEDGDIIESCAVIECAVPVGKLGEYTRSKMGPWEKLVVEVLSEFSLAQTAGIEVVAVIEEALRRSEAPTDGKRDTRKQRLRRAINSLTEGDDAPFMLEDGCITVL